MTKENIKSTSASKKRSRTNLPKIITIFMLIATIALYISTIVYQVAAAK
jgi:hypothetical protein